MTQTPAIDAKPSKRALILEAALSLFAERGFHGTAVPQVAKLAGVGAGTIYRHFDGKEALVNELYRHWKARLMTALLDGFPFSAAPREQFGAFWQRLADFARAEPTAFAFLELHHHAPYLDQQSRELELRSLEPIGAFVQQAVSSGVARALPPAVLIAAVWGTFVGLIKAEQMGHLQLTDELIRATEQACWCVVSRDP